MKKFITLLIMFFAGLLGLAYIADFIISKNLRKSTSRMLIGWNEIYSGKLQHDVVIMGSSRAWVHYNPQILDTILGINSYNLGIDGSLIDRQILKYNTYRRFNLKPKFIIQNIDRSTLGITNGYEREQFFPYFSFDDSLKTISSNYEKFNVLQRFIPCYRYGGYTSLVKKGFSTDLDEKDIIKGYQGKNLLWDGTELARQDTIHYSHDSLALSLFDKYLSKAYSENIKIIFVYAPMYIGATKKIKNIEGMYAMYDSIAQKYDIPILDYNYDPISYDATYFYNALHLNKTGAELFSTKLAHDIDSLQLFK